MMLAPLTVLCGLGPAAGSRSWVAGGPARMVPVAAGGGGGSAQCIGAIWVVDSARTSIHRPAAARASEKGRQLRLSAGPLCTPCIEMSRPKRRNGAAYLHRHRRFRTGGHAIDSRNYHQWARSHGVAPHRSTGFESQEPPVRHGPIVLPSPCPGTWTGRLSRGSKKSRSKMP